MECKECGTLVESEPFYTFDFRVKDIPKRLIDEAEERYEKKKEAGHYTKYYGSKGRLVRRELQLVILSKLRFWYEEEEIDDKELDFTWVEDLHRRVCGEDE